MTTHHRFVFADSRTLENIEAETIDLVVTSPPYPMVEMWDGVFAELNPQIGYYLEAEEGDRAFEAMHRELDRVWLELQRVVKPGGFVCINIGDATRTIGRHFQLYSNHSRIVRALTHSSFQPLPVILWHKTTNAPTKFMGSGMLPAGAYVTLEHEYILIFRKGGKRAFRTEQAKRLRRKSAMFWEERNRWFSDLWEFPGIGQEIGNGNLRARSAAYPFELAYRLINMYSVKGDLVLDPFLGSGTTVFAAIASARNSIGVEHDAHFQDVLLEHLPGMKDYANTRLEARIFAHREFIHKQMRARKPVRYHNIPHGFPVMTRQEQELELESVTELQVNDGTEINVSYTPLEHIEGFTANPLSAENATQNPLP